MGSKGGSPMLDYTTCKKISCKCEMKCLQGKILLLSIPPTCFQMTLLVGLPESSGGQVKSFCLLASSHHGSPMLIYHLGDEEGLLMAAVQRHSFTPIDMISQINQLHGAEPFLRSQ
jgi:hypothetical protein